MNFNGSIHDSVGRVQERYRGWTRKENDSIVDPEQAQERIRLEKIESALKDEGAATWSMQKAT